MNFKKLFLAAALSVTLASCDTGGNVTPSKNKLFADVVDFLETRDVTVDKIPYIDSASDSAVIYSESIAGDDDYAPCFYFVIQGNVVDESLAALKAGEWTVPETASEYGYECVNKPKTIEIDISYVETSDEANKIYAGTNYYVYAYADLNSYNESDNGGNGGNTQSDVLVDNIIAFLKTRSVTVISLPYFGNTKLDDVVYYEVDDGSGEYYPCFYVILEGDVVNNALAAFRTAGWTVPTQASEDYGYECVNSDETVEIDILYLDPADPENEGVGGTSFCVYAYADLYGGGEEGGDDDWDIDWTDPDAAVALAIAANIFGEANAEENVSWFLYFFVMNTIDGNDLEAAVAVAARYLPDGFTLEGAVEVDTETDEDTGESYDVGYGAYVNATGVIVEIDTYLSDEEGKIDVMYWVFVEGEDDYDDTGDDFDFDSLTDPKSGSTDANAAVNVTNNADGSKTSVFSFSQFANQATFNSQTAGDVTIKTKLGDNKSNKPAYFEKGASLRMYWGTALQFSVSQGHEIVKIEFDLVQAKSDTIMGEDLSLAILNGTYRVNNDHVTISATEGVNNVIMALDIGGSGHIAFANISVTYK